MTPYSSKQRLIETEYCTQHYLDYAVKNSNLGVCELDDQGISKLANTLAIRNASILELNLDYNRITSAGIRALVDGNVEAVKTLTNLCLSANPIGSEEATILADALGRNAMPSPKRLDLYRCDIEDDSCCHCTAFL